MKSGSGAQQRLETIDTFFEAIGSTSDGNLVLKFLAAFARFEYALKRAGYLSGDEKGCFPDWGKFQAEHGTEFSGLYLEGLAEAKHYLSSFFPKKLIVREGSMAWSESLPPHGRSSLEFQAIMVRRVRNNLFHGEKTSIFVGRDGMAKGPAVIGEPSRNELLLRCCLVLLEAFLKCSFAVRSAFSAYIPDDV